MEELIQGFLLWACPLRGVELSAHSQGVQLEQTVYRSVLCLTQESTFLPSHLPASRSEMAL